MAGLLGPQHGGGSSSGEDWAWGREKQCQQPQPIEWVDVNERVLAGAAVHCDWDRGRVLVGLQEYFYDQGPGLNEEPGHRILLECDQVGKLHDQPADHSHRSGHGGPGREQLAREDLDSSRLDNFYWLLVAAALVNLSLYVVLARRYSHRSV